MKKTISRFFGFFAPDATQVVIIVALGVIVVLFLAMRFASSERLEATVTINDDEKQTGSNGVTKQTLAAISAGETDANVRLAERVREASAVGLGLSLTIVRQRLETNKIETDLAALLKKFAASELMPPQTNLITPDAALPYGIMGTTRGLYYIRYNPSPLKLEILACGHRGLQDGAVFVLRVPDTTAASSASARPVVAPYNSQTAYAGYWASLFVSPDNKDAYLPPPFSSAEIYLRAGWRVEPLRATQFSQEKLQLLNSFLQQHQTGN